MAKLTQKEKIAKSFIFANTIRSMSRQLKDYCKDYDFHGGQTIANDLIEECEEFLKDIK